MGRRTRLVSPTSKPAKAVTEQRRPGVDTLDPAIRGIALRLADGDPFRIDIVTPRLCYVR